MNGTYCYSIEIIMPLGKRCGTLSLKINDRHLTGRITVLGNSNYLSGNFLLDGRISLTGQLQTLLYALPFTASGRITEKVLNLQLNTAKGLFPLTGVAAL